MRLFIAIEFTPPVRAALCAVMDGLRRQGVSGTYTAPDNLHLTLAFIGESEDAEGIRRVMDSVSCAPFRLTLSGSGRFDNLLWTGVDGGKNLTALADQLRRELRAAGFAVDRQTFKPHITLVRRAVCRGRYRMDVPSVGMTVRSITLMNSDRIDGKLTYTPVYVRSF